MSNNVRGKASAIHMVAKPRGCAAVPYNKKKVAVFGAGGNIGASVFGFLQRCGSLYGTGIGGVETPRAICATAVGLESLNKLLGRSFKLAFAGEHLARLTNMQDVNAIAQRLKGYDAAMIGTVYTLEKRPVSLNTYEENPNSKTFEMYMGERYMVEPEDVDEEFNLSLFQNSIEGCKLAGLQHIVIYETPDTTSQPYIDILMGSGIPFTYIQGDGNHVNTKNYNFEKGVQSELSVEAFKLSDRSLSGEVQQFIGDSSTSSSNVDLAREDLAALGVQALMSLDWEKSRCLKVSSVGPVVTKEESGRRKKVVKSDGEWCMNSGTVAELLSTLE